MKRISTFLPSDNMQYYMRIREWRRNELTDKMGSQTRIKQLRDDPLAAGRVVRCQSGMARMETFKHNVEMVRSHLSYTEGELMQVMDILQRTNEIAIQGANGIYSAEQTAYMAEEVDQLLHELVTLGNAKSELGDSLFAGFRLNGDAFRVGTGPVSASKVERIVSVDYIGDIGRNAVEITQGAHTFYNLPGNVAFWAENQQIYASTEATNYQVQEDSLIRIDGVDIRLTGGDNIYAVMSKINDSTAAVKAHLDPVSNALVLSTTTAHQLWAEDVGQGTVLQDLGILAEGDDSPPMNLAPSARAYGGSIFDMVIHLRDGLLAGNTEDIGGATLRGVQDSIEQVSHMLADIGAQDTRLQITAARLEHDIPEVLDMSSQELDLDVTEAITQLKMLEYTHQAAVATSARLLTPTLLDFLR